MEKEQKEAKGLDAFLTLTGVIFWLGFVAHFGWLIAEKFLKWLLL